jgi:hypothetical protein
VRTSLCFLIAIISSIDPFFFFLTSYEQSNPSFFLSGSCELGSGPDLSHLLFPCDLNGIGTMSVTECAEESYPMNHCTDGSGNPRRNDHAHLGQPQQGPAVSSLWRLNVEVLGWVSLHRKAYKLQDPRLLLSGPWGWH